MESRGIYSQVFFQFFPSLSVTSLASPHTTQATSNLTVALLHTALGYETQGTPKTAAIDGDNGCQLIGGGYNGCLGVSGDPRSSFSLPQTRYIPRTVVSNQSGVATGHRAKTTSAVSKNGNDGIDDSP